MVIKTPKPYELLIADDSRRFRETLRELLEPEEGLRLHEVESGEEAIEYAQDVKIDIVLLDMHMHVMTGLETLRELKCLDALRPCILITSEATEKLRQDALEADAWSVLSKPVYRAELRLTVSEALQDAYQNPGASDLGSVATGF
ncbi:response regulator [Fuerstiella marisgermanici]|uniref:Cyclic di-GMP phosphodiesterase response regulator RpfG n=1 Tax=Fuerstiella marisgermanici TaxID=1891926 RepID=A0A1P8WSD7_9PLAN|nr:response regulator [Fuerstiella marisgermanici]APZ96951.1 Cyclic di-GMP phosphodiesterase response regulator RpfG [Fuerstiella marisgermanici]